MRVETNGMPQQGPTVQEKSPGLDRLASAVVSGDWFSDCMGLSACGMSEQFGLQRQNLQRKHQALQEYKERLEELRAEQEKKAREASKWGCLGKVLGAVCSVVGMVLSIYCPAAGRAVGAVGAGLASGCAVTAHTYGDQATECHVRSMKMSTLKADAAEDGARQLQVLEDMAATEQRMGRRLLDLLASEKQAEELAAREGA